MAFVNFTTGTDDAPVLVNVEQIRLVRQEPDPTKARIEFDGAHHILVNASASAVASEIEAAKRAERMSF